MSRAIANRYARALVDVVLDPSSPLAPEQAVAQVQAFESLVRASEELRGVLLTPAVPLARKRAVVSRLAASLSISKTVMNFLFVVVDRRRAGMLPEIREAFEVLLDERLGIARATVCSARELSGDQRETLSRRLSGMTGRRVRCRFTVDPALIGGAVVQVGSRVYDGSVRGQLEGLRARLLE